MSVTKTIIQNSPTRAKIKINADAPVTTGEAGIVIKKAVTIASTPTLTFTVGNNGTATILRSAGTWAGDITTALGGVPQAETLNTTPYGGYFYLDLSVVTALSTSNKKVFTVTSMTDDTVTVQETVAVADAGKASTGIAAYYSDLGWFNVNRSVTLGAASTTPQVNIDSIWCSDEPVGGSHINVKRNSTSILYLSGVTTIQANVFSEYNTYDIDTLITSSSAAGGFIIYELIKVDGFVG